MPQDRETLIINTETKEIRSFSIGKDDLLRLCQLLQQRSFAAGDIEVANFRQDQQIKEEYEEKKRAIRSSFELRITVKGLGGQELFGSISDVFDSPNFPDQLASIFIGSDTVFTNRYNIKPRNYFQILLDFCKPPVLDMSFLPSQATPNTSEITVRGFDPTWVNGVFHEVTNFVNKHPSQFTWIHKHSIYDFSLFILGIPFGFWMVYKLSDVLNRIFAGVSIFVQNASYVYVFLISLIVWRIIFHYARWICPLVEYQSPKSKTTKHRVILIAICLGIITSIIYDIIKALL